MSKNQVENIKVDGWDVTVTYMPDNGKYVAEAFDSNGQKFDYVASHDRQQTINTAVALANAGEYYRPFGSGSVQLSNTTNDFFRDYDPETKKTLRKVIRYHKGMKRENFAQFKASAILAILGVGFVASLFMFIVSLLS